jgi:hypothetical protein
MKRLIYVLAIACSLLLPVTLAVGSAAAVNVFQPCSGAAKATHVCSDANAQTAAKTNPIIIALKALLELLSIIAGVASIVVLIISGFRFITSDGDANSIKTARDGVLYVVIGIVVVVVAQSIIAYVINKI